MTTWVYFALLPFLVYKLSKHNFLKHFHFKTQNQFNQLLNATLIHNSEKKNEVCIIFLHGYGSNKQQGFALIDFLPKQMDLCCFDFSASGKSQGKNTTYGIKEFRDIRTIIKELKRQNMSYKKFILWGRSMGAVASFLIMCSNQQIDMELRKDILYQVLDSPFSTFSSICYYQAKKSFKLPEAFISYGIDILKSCLKDYPSHLNPFQIDLPSISERCFTNSLFVYSQNDQIIPQENTFSIIQKLPTSTYYHKLLIPQSHNALRSSNTYQEIFKVLLKNHLKYLYNINKSKDIVSKKLDMPLNKFLTNSCSIQRQEFKRQSPKNVSLISSQKYRKKEIQKILGFEGPKDELKKEKKYLELFSSTEYRSKIHYLPKSHGQNQINKNKQFSTTYHEIPTSHQEEKQQSRQRINSKNILRQSRSLRRTKTIDFSDCDKKLEIINNCQSLLKPGKIQSIANTIKKKKYLKQNQEKNKAKRRALYCSLNKKQQQFVNEKEINKKCNNLITFKSIDIPRNQ